MIRPARTHQTGSARLPENRGAGTFQGLYTIAENCFQCHTVPNQELVNTGLHPAGSAFDLVSWSQGEVRHNYQYSSDQKNRPATQERLRVMYVVGLLTDLDPAFYLFLVCLAAVLASLGYAGRIVFRARRERWSTES